MFKRRILTVILTALVALILVFASVSVAFADEGGIPNAKSSNGAAHANENSAHHKNAEPPPSASCVACLCDSTGCTFDTGGTCACDESLCELDDAELCDGEQVYCTCLEHQADSEES